MPTWVFLMIVDAVKFEIIIIPVAKKGKKWGEGSF